MISFDHCSRTVQVRNRVFYNIDPLPTHGCVLILNGNFASFSPEEILVTPMAALYVKV